MPGGGNGLTPTQRRLYDALADGEPHSLRELLRLLDAPPGERADALTFKTAYATLQNHVKNLRKRVRLKGQDIVCQLIWRRRNYRLVRVLFRTRNSVSNAK